MKKEIKKYKLTKRQELLWKAVQRNKIISLDSLRKMATTQKYKPTEVDHVINVLCWKNYLRLVDNKKYRKATGRMYRWEKNTAKTYHK
ncbi:MAG: hypothetical protein ABIP51_19200 [Bacteroidia bacterium]